MWLGGGIALWVIAAASYLRLRYRLRFAIKLSEGIYETDLIDSPCVAGLFAPHIYLLPNLTAQQREHILLHEQMHSKYFDQLSKILSYGIISLHWFNPVLWIMFRYFQAELEKACDERLKSSVLYNVSHRIRNRNMAYLDMDGDGKAEKIVLEPSPETKPDTAPDEPLRYYRLRIGEDALDGYGYSMANTLFAFRLNGQMLLALYEDGPSADPCTYFYRYENGKIKEAGSIEADIRQCSIGSDGIIKGSLWKEIVQTDFIEVCWQLEDGMLTEIPQETYDFLARNSVELLETLPLHEDIGRTGTFLI